MKLINPKSIILLAITICLVVTTNIHWGKNKWQNILEADAKGYYAYLPAVFIYHDLNFGFYDSIEKKKYFNDFLIYDYRSHAPNGSTIDKYYCGTAIAQLPFFLTAHALSAVSGNDPDGYSRLYLLLITLAAIFYLFLGLWYVNKLLELYSISSRNRSFSLVAMLFGTNLYFYSVGEMGMSHVYSFAFIALFCFYAKRYLLQQRSKDLLVIFALTGMIFLIRPVNVLILLSIPFLAGSLHTLRNGFASLKRNIKALIGGIFVLFAIICIQAVIYKISSGDWWIYSYGEERFHFNDPHFIDILFSYKKGLFLYTPLYLLALGGLYVSFRKNKFEFFSFFFFFVMLTYVLSSWWNWWYGGSFSSRVYVEYLPLFTVMLAVLLQNAVTKPARIITVSMVVLLIALCQFQTYQYRYYLIHWENMTKEKYRNVFLSMDKSKVTTGNN